MSKELDELSDTCEEYVELLCGPAKPTLKERIVDSWLFSLLFFPILNLIDDLKSLKDKGCVHVTDSIEVWMKFLLLGGGYTMVAFAIGTILYQLSLLPAETLITVSSIILVLVLIITVPVWLITRWANKK